MIRKALAVVPIVLAAGLTGPAHAQCVATTDIHHAELANGVVIHATETNPAAGCTGGVTRTIVITQGPNSCSGSPADVVTDPFGFGGGPRSAETESCGANYALNVAFEPPMPVPDSIVFDQNGPSVDAELRKQVTVQGGTYATPFGSGTIPAGTPASVGRALHASA